MPNIKRLLIVAEKTVTNSFSSLPGIHHTITRVCTSATRPIITRVITTGDSYLNRLGFLCFPPFMPNYACSFENNKHLGIFWYMALLSSQ
jgi:hypothetical protein